MFIRTVIKHFLKQPHATVFIDLDIYAAICKNNSKFHLEEHLVKGICINGAKCPK